MIAKQRIVKMTNDDYQKKIEKLYTEFPLCFPQPPICGFTIGPGWFEIVRNLCSKIEKILTENNEHEFSIDQVKEKFGGLRCYWGGYTPEDILEQIELLITDAEIQCSKTCETCGAPGTLRTDIWMRTICDNCEQERIRNRSIEMRKSAILIKAKELFGKSWKEWDEFGEKDQEQFLQNAEKQLLEEDKIQPKFNV